MDIKRKTHDIQTWKKHLFLSIFSINIDALSHHFTSGLKPAVQKSFDYYLSQFLAEGELGCFHCTEAYFDVGWQRCTHDLSPVTIPLSKSSPPSAY
jgi:hypothetical protein